MEDDTGGFLHHGGIGGDIEGYHRVGADPGIVAHGDVADDLGSGADVDVFADGGRALTPAVGEGVGADGHLMIDGAPLADLRAVGDKNARQTVGSYKGLHLIHAGNDGVVSVKDLLVAVNIQGGKQPAPARGADDIFPGAPKLSLRNGMETAADFSQ